MTYKLIIILARPGSSHNRTCFMSRYFTQIENIMYDNCWTVLEILINTLSGQDKLQKLMPVLNLYKSTLINQIWEWW